MAFNQNSNVAPITQDENWKSQAFINFYLPSKEGGRRKLGSIGLKTSKPAEAGLIEWLQEDPSRVAVVAEKLEIDFQMADGDATKGFDL